MSKESHTPGPWIAYEETNHRGKKNGEWWVASNGPGFALPVSSPGAPLPYDEANARLISACPDMLQALKLVTENLTDAGLEVYFKMRGARKIRDAIAKAEGRS